MLKLFYNISKDKEIRIYTPITIPVNEVTQRRRNSIFALYLRIGYKKYFGTCRVMLTAVKIRPVLRLNEVDKPFTVNSGSQERRYKIFHCRAANNARNIKMKNLDLTLKTNKYKRTSSLRTLLYQNFVMLFSINIDNFVSISKLKLFSKHLNVPCHLFTWNYIFYSQQKISII